MKLPWFSFLKFLDIDLDGFPRMPVNTPTARAESSSMHQDIQMNHIFTRNDPPASNVCGWHHIVDTVRKYTPLDCSRAVLPFSSDVEWPAEINQSMALESISSSHWGFKMLIYLASNRLLGSYDVAGIWEMIEKAGIKQIAKLSYPSYTRNASLAAALECLFEAGILQGHDRIVSWLLDAGVDPNKKIRMHFTETNLHLPLIAARSRSYESWMVRLLLSRGASPVMICCQYHGSPIQYMFWEYLRHFQEEDVWNDLEIFDAYLEIFDAYLEAIATWDHQTESRSHQNSHRDSGTNVCLLADQSPDKLEQRVIRRVEDYATRTSQPSLSLINVKTLIYAVEGGSQGVIRLMHKYGLPMDCCDQNGRTPLAVAMEPTEVDLRYGIMDLDRIRILLELGASPNYHPEYETINGCSSALQAAVNCSDILLDGQIDAIELLTQHGAQAQGRPNCGEKDHLTLVDCALSQEKWSVEELINVLLALQDAGSPLSERSLISILERAYRTGDYHESNVFSDKHITSLREAFGNPLNLSNRSERGWTALDYAVSMYEFELERLLVDHGAKLTRTFAYSQCLAGNFSSREVEDVISRLPTPQTDKQARDLVFHHLIGILMAAQTLDQDFKIVSKLLHEYCLTSRSSKHDACVLYKACVSSEAEIIEVTMELLPDAYSSAALDTLITSRMLSIEERRRFTWELLKRRRRASLNWSEKTRVFLHVVKKAWRNDGDEKILEWLREHDKKAVEYANLRPSTFAIRAFTHDGTKLWRLPDITEWFHWGLEASSYLGLLVVYSGQVEVMDTLLRQGFQPNRRICWSLTALQLAVKRADRPMTLRLLEAGCDVNSRPPWRDIPKSISWYIPREIQEVLASYKLQTHRRTALQLAVEKGDLSIIKLLLEYGADVNGPAAPMGGATALQLACIEGYIEIVRLLISKGADINASGAKYFGRTALEGAAENGRLDIAYLLLERDCRVDGSFRQQYIRAVGFARARGYHVLSNVLKDLGKWNKEDANLLGWTNLRDKKPGCRDRKQELHEDESISEVDSDDLNSRSNEDISYHSGESDSEEYDSTDEEGNATMLVSHVNQAVMDESDSSDYSTGPSATQYSACDELFEYYADEDDEMS